MSGVEGEEGCVLKCAKRLSEPPGWVASMQQIWSSGVVVWHDARYCSLKRRAEEPKSLLRQGARRQQDL